MKMRWNIMIDSWTTTVLELNTAESPPDDFCADSFKVMSPLHASSYIPDTLTLTEPKEIEHAKNDAADKIDGTWFCCSDPFSVSLIRVANNKHFTIASFVKCFPLCLIDSFYKMSENSSSNNSNSPVPLQQNIPSGFLLSFTVILSMQHFVSSIRKNTTWAF